MFLALLLGVALLSGFLYRFWHIFQHGYIRLWAIRLVTKYMKANYTIIDRFCEVVKKQPNRPFVRFQDECYTFRQADELSNKTARVFLQRVKKGDVVAIYSQNSPMFVWTWLGLVKVGCVGAFLNFNIRSKSLLHCLKVSGAKLLVVAEGKLATLLNTVEKSRLFR